MNYTLMNKNNPVLDFVYNNDLNVITEITNIYNLNYAPLILSNSTQEKLLKCFNDWFNDRGIPVYRDNAREILETFGVNNVKELTNKDYSLSLSDQYWFKPEYSKVKWEDINYFEKNYDSVAFADATYGSGASASLNQANNGAKNDKSPNNTTNGQLKKLWIKRDNKNYLLKGAGTLHNFEPINEVLASKICNIIGLPCAEYTLDVVHSRRQDTLVSVCECLINSNQEIIPAYAVLSERSEQVTKTSNDYYLYLNILKEHNVPNCEEYLQKMFLLDYIMLNEDRHTNNFGIIRDVETLEWISMCPVFDTGRSMNTNVTTSYWDFENGEVKCFTSDFISSKHLEQFFTFRITHSQIAELRALSKVYSDMLDKYKQYTKLSDEELSQLKQGYDNRIDLLENVFKSKGLLVDEVCKSIRSQFKNNSKTHNGKINTKCKKELPLR